MLGKITLLAFSLLLLVTSANSAEQQQLSLSMPAGVLSEVIQKSLPFPLTPSSETLSGDIAVTRMDNLRLGKQSIAAQVGITGNNVQLTTAVAGQQFRLNVGNVELDFSVVADLSFDSARQQLLITPTITDLATGGAPKAGDIASLLAGLFNGRTIPLTIEPLQPIITNTGSKELSIQFQVADIASSPESLTLYLNPTISTQANQ